MIIHNPILTGSFTVNGTDVASITGSAASITAINSYTASQNILNGTYTLTSSFAAQTASFTAFTSSVNSFTASQLVLNGTYATTGSNTFAGIQTVNSNLVVTGSITAQTLVVQTITSSVDFVTGSTRFGSILDNTHIFSGSVTMNPGGLFVSSSGLVGIGATTSSIGSRLVVSGSIESLTDPTGEGGQITLRGNTFQYAVDNFNGTGLRFIKENDGTGASGSVLMSISSSGNVGIGTSSPSQPLQLGLVSVIAQDQNSMYVGANFANAVDGNYIKAQYANQIHFDSAQGHINFKVAGTGSAGAAITYTTAMRITAAGNVGIGTNSPLALLHLSSSTSTAAYIHSTGTGNYASLNLTNNTTGYGYDVGFGGSTSIAPNCFYIYGGAIASVKLAVASNGNIGIGTVYPSASLEVSGSVYVGGNTSNSNYKFLVKRGTDRNMGIGLQGTDLSIEFVNDIYTANVPTRIYANPLVLLGGQVLIGTATAIFNSQVNINYNQSTYEGLAISTDKAYNAQPQPNLIFGGKYNSSGDYRQYATIQSYKDNTTNSDSAASLVFYTNGNSASVTERMRITSEGDVGIGTTGGINIASGWTNLTVNGTTTGLIGLKANGTDFGAMYASISNNNFVLQAYGTSNTGNMVFLTASTERMRITSVGSVLLGTTTDVNNVRLQVAASGGVGSWISGTFAGPGGTDKVVLGNLAGYTGASIGAHNSALSAWAQLNINPGGGAVYAGTSRLDNISDERIKDNIQPISGCLDKILLLNGKKFHLKDEPEDKIRYGFIAQEVQSHLSDFVIESTREYKDENIHIENLLTLENSGTAWAALLVEAIKELKAEIDKLKNK